MSIGSGVLGLTPVLVVAVAALVVALAWVGLRALARRHAADHRSRRRRGASQETSEVAARASASLVATDEAITAARQDLGFAQAQFGPEATATFEAALTAATASLSRAFVLRQQLDDTSPDNEAHIRATAVEILRMCAQIRTDVATHAHEFDALRDLQARAPELLDEVTRQAADAGERVRRARLTVTGLSGWYSPAALASVSGNPDLVERLVEGITSTVGVGRAALGVGDSAAALAAVRSSQAAVAQAASLLDAVDQAGEHLAAAASQLADSIAALEQDLADAAHLAPTDPQVQAQAAVATATAAQAQRAGADRDPVATLRAVAHAQSELSARLAPYRDQAERVAAARRQLTDVLGHATAQIGAVGEFIDARRGAVGPEARTRLADAARRARQAEDLSDSDPVAALSEARQADRLAGTAQNRAQQDVADFDEQQRGGGGGVLGGSGGAVLGGLLIDQLLRGHGRGFGGYGRGGC